MARRKAHGINRAMAKDPNRKKPLTPDDGPPEVEDLLTAELLRRGMTEAEIKATTKKRKRRKVLEMNAVRTRWLKPPMLGAAAEPSRKPAPYRGPTRESSEELCTVDFAAARLQLHPKTVLRFIRDGRLRGTRVGKAYRILRADLDAFAGMPIQPQQQAGPAWVTSIVDIPNVGPELARKWAQVVPGALTARSGDGPPMRADVIYEVERSHLKIVLVGPPDDTVKLLTLIRVWLDQLSA